MNDTNGFVRKTNNFRIWVDEAGVGQIRILKRINFTMVIPGKSILFFIYPNPSMMRCLSMQKNSWDSASPVWASNSTLC